MEGKSRYFGAERGVKAAFGWPCKAKRRHAELAEEERHKGSTLNRCTERVQTVKNTSPSLDLTGGSRQKVGRRPQTSLYQLPQIKTCVEPVGEMTYLNGRNETSCLCVCSAAGHEGTVGADGFDWKIGASGQSLNSSFILWFFQIILEHFPLSFLIHVNESCGSVMRLPTLILLGRNSKQTLNYLWFRAFLDKKLVPGSIILQYCQPQLPVWIFGCYQLLPPPHPLPSCLLGLLIHDPLFIWRKRSNSRH